MSAPFPNPAWNNTLQVFQYVNTSLMDGWLGTSILITFWAIAFVRLKVYNNNISAFAGASFFLAIMGVLLWALDLANNYALVLSILMVTVAGLMLIVGKPQFE